MASPIVVDFTKISSPYVVNLAGVNTGNYAENKVTFLVTSSGTIVLPAISSLTGNSVDVFIVTTTGAVTLVTASGDTYASNPKGSSITVAASGAAEVTPAAGNLWVVRSNGTN